MGSQLLADFPFCLSPWWRKSTYLARNLGLWCQREFIFYLYPDAGVVFLREDFFVHGTIELSPSVSIFEDRGLPDFLGTSGKHIPLSVLVLDYVASLTSRCFLGARCQEILLSVSVFGSGSAYLVNFFCSSHYTVFPFCLCTSCWGSVFLESLIGLLAPSRFCFMSLSFMVWAHLHGGVFWVPGTNSSSVSTWYGFLFKASLSGFLELNRFPFLSLSLMKGFVYLVRLLAPCHQTTSPFCLCLRCQRSTFLVRLGLLAPSRFPFLW